VSQKIEEVKQLVEFWQWQCANRLQHLSKKCDFLVFLFYQIVQKHNLFKVV